MSISAAQPVILRSLSAIVGGPWTAVGAARLLSQSCRTLNNHHHHHHHNNNNNHHQSNGDSKKKKDDHLPKIDPSIYMRYREKLQQKAKDTGARSYDELLKGVKHKNPHHTKNKDVNDDKKQDSTTESSPQQRRPQQPVIKDKHKQQIRSLDTFVDVDKMRQLLAQSDPQNPYKQVELLWRLRFVKDPNSLCAIVPPETFTKMLLNARRYPMFILPLPSNLSSSNHNEAEPPAAAQLHLIQWVFPAHLTTHVLMTSLAEYKLQQQFARPHTTLIFHSDLAQPVHNNTTTIPAGPVLMNGNVAPDLGVSIDDAHFLTQSLQKFYATADQTAPHTSDPYIRAKLLTDFAQGNVDFSIDTLLDQVDKST